MLASDFTWSDYVEYVISKVNQRLGLLSSVKHLLPLNARKLFYNSLVLPFFYYADLVWGEKNSYEWPAGSTEQGREKLSLTGHFNYSSATDAIETLKWLNLEQLRFYHPCTYVYQCINGLMDHPMELTANRDIPNYNTRNRDMLGLPLATKDWGK